MEIICDASELTGVWGADAPDTFLIAGYSIPVGSVQALNARIELIKNDLLGHTDVPIKWNLKDIGRALSLHELSELKPLIIERSNVIRGQMLQVLRELGATLFMSVLQGYSNDKQVLGRLKDDLVRYSFCGLLQRLGLFCADNSAADVQLILDWPDKNQKHLFVDEYHKGWRDGKSFTAEESVTYYCGPLRKVGFRASLLFGVTDLDIRLQVADLVVGACRSFVNFCMGRTEKEDFGVKQFQALAPQLYRIDGWKCFGRGITVAPANSPFSQIILDGFNALGC